MKKYSDEECSQLSSIEWDQLEPGERRAVSAWRKRVLKENKVIPTPRVVLKPSNPVEAASKPVEADVHPVDPVAETVEKPVRKLNVKPEPVDGDGLAALVHWVDGFPANIETGSHRNESPWLGVAQALREYRCVGLLKQHVERRKAMALRNSIRSARIKSFSPAGSYRAEIAPETTDNTLFGVYAQYVGGDPIEDQSR